LAFCKLLDEVKMDTGRVILSESLPQEPALYRGVIVGFGFSEHAEVFGQKRWAPVSFRRRGVWLEVGDTSSAACSGDSGGPLLRTLSPSTPGHWSLIGIASWGWSARCAGNKTYYTPLAPFIDWLEEASQVSLRENRDRTYIGGQSTDIRFDIEISSLPAGETLVILQEGQNEAVVPLEVTVKSQGVAQERERVVAKLWNSQDRLIGSDVDEFAPYDFGQIALPLGIWRIEVQVGATAQPAAARRVIRVVPVKDLRDEGNEAGCSFVSTRVASGRLTLIFLLAFLLRLSRTKSDPQRRSSPHVGRGGKNEH